uniref:Ceramide synthase 2-like n=1 Tax=Sinocyclocheilus anshuiensis TaxID=1608454 RepID=A0A671RCG3_9TELE
MEQLSQWLWKQEYWLPPGISWEDLEKMEGSRRPLPRDLLLALPLALGFIMLRYAFERRVAFPLSRVLGVKDRVCLKITAVPKLEAFYTKNSRQPTQNEISSLVNQCNLTHRQVETWFRNRRNQDRPSNSKKFCEFCCLCLTPWFWDHRECWRGFPQQPVQDAHYWYYMLELGFYWSLLLCVSVDVKRKVRSRTIVAHSRAICFLNLNKISLVFPQSAKMLNYAGWKKTCDSLFVIFAAVFLVTRLLVFPSKIIYTTLVLSMEVFEPFIGYYIFNALLLVLQVLHIYWAYLILRMIYKFLFLGKLDKDERSDVESEAEEEEEEEDRSSWRKRKVVLDSRLAMLSSSCVLNNLTNQKADVNRRLPKAR